MRNWLADKTIIVCHSPQFVFVKAPRTGGTSIFQGALQRQMGLDLWTRSSNEDEFLHWVENTSVLWHGYDSFTVVRNPYDRVVSIYMYAIRARMEGVSFRDFVLNFAKYDEDPFVAFHRRSCFEHVYNGHWAVVSRNFKFETLTEDFHRFCEDKGLPKVELPHISKTDRGHYREYYDDETREAVAAEYAKDLRMFGYQF